MERGYDMSDGADTNMDHGKKSDITALNMKDERLKCKDSKR